MWAVFMSLLKDIIKVVNSSFLLEVLIRSFEKMFMKPICLCMQKPVLECQKGLIKIIAWQDFYFHVFTPFWTPLMAQWIRTFLLMQRTQVQSLVQEDTTCHGTTKPVHHNYWACILGLMNCSYWAHMPQLVRTVCLRACAPQQEKSAQWEVCTPQLEKACT